MAGPVEQRHAPQHDERHQHQRNDAPAARPGRRHEHREHGDNDRHVGGAADGQQQPDDAEERPGGRRDASAPAKRAAGGQQAEPDAQQAEAGEVERVAGGTRQAAEPDRPVRPRRGDLERLQDGDRHRHDQ